jgi:hypothetical protein
MAHDDQFTATGPPFTGSGVPRTGFSTRATGMVDGANVQGDRTGIYAESVRAETGRAADVDGVGAYGVGDNFGVFGKTDPSPGRPGIAGLYGQHNRGGVGGIGAVMRGGTGLAGVSVGSLGNPLQTFASLPSTADGSGVGVFGSSGSGAGVRGTSRGGAGGSFEASEGPGVIGKSDTAAGVAGTSGAGAGGVFFATDGPGISCLSLSERGGLFGSGRGDPASLVAQVGIVPQPMPVRNVVPARPVQFDPRGLDSLPKDGRGGDLLVTKGDDNVCTLWFCTRGQEAEASPATWSQVLLGDVARPQDVSQILWAQELLASTGGGGPGQDPHDVLGEPNGTTHTLVASSQATYGKFTGRHYPDLGELIGSGKVIAGDAVTPGDLARAHVIAFESNGGSPASGGGWESCDWSFTDGVTVVTVSWDGRVGAPRDPHIVANGSIRGAAYKHYFGLPPGAPIGDAEVMSFLLFALPEVRTDDPGFAVTVGEPARPTAGETTPDIDAIGVLVGHG